MIESVDPTTITNFSGSGGSGYQLVDTQTGVIGQPTFSFIMLNTVTAPTNDLAHPPGPGQGHEPGRGPEDHRRAAGQAGHRPLPPRLALLQQHRLPHLRPGRGQRTGQPVQGPARHADHQPAHHPRPARDQGGPGRPADVAAGRVRRHRLRGRAGHHHRRLRRSASSRRSPPTSSGRSTPTSTTSGGAPPPSPPSDPSASTSPGSTTRRSRRPCWRDATPPTRPPGSRPTRRSTSGWPRICPTCGSSSTCSPRWPTRGSRTSTTRPSPTAWPGTASTKASSVPTQIWLA